MSSQLNTLEDHLDSGCSDEMLRVQKLISTEILNASKSYSGCPLNLIKNITNKFPKVHLPAQGDGFSKIVYT